jgi:hypothetical protein
MNREVNLTKRSKHRRDGGIAALCFLQMDESSPML